MKIALFLTRGMSLSKWEKIGTLDREIKPYLELAKTHDITIFTYGKDKPIKGLTILPIWKSLFMKFDYLKTNQMDGSWMAVINKKLHGGKLIIRCGYEWLRFLENVKAPKWKQWIAYWVERFAYGNADTVVITSETEAEFIVSRFNDYGKWWKVNVIPNYIDMERFKPMDYPKEKDSILCVGRNSKEKNIEGVKQYAKDHNLKLTHITGGVPQSELPRIYNEHEYYIQLSTTEGCSKTLLEARACGCKCIVSNIPANKEIMDRPIEDFSFDNIFKLEKQLYEG
jgi:glycosyltransferase involved in cell wall biosynthesis